MNINGSSVFSRAVHEPLDTGIDLRGRIGIRIVPRLFNPYQRKSGFFVPGFRIAPAGAGLVFCSANQKNRTSQRIRAVGFYRFGKHAKSMAGQRRVARLVAIVHKHHGTHQLSAILGCRDAPCALSLIHI